MIHVGFTGTRHGMTPQQFAKVGELISDLSDTYDITAHHGDCTGADAQFHEIAYREGALLVIHPPVDESRRAYCKPADQWRSPLTHLARNRAIVAESDVMIATPFEMMRQPRGGTWYTIDRAVRSGKPLAVVLPDGQVVYDGAPWPV